METATTTATKGIQADRPQVAQLPARQSAVTPDQMLMTALEKGVAFDQLEKLLDLQQRWEANEARKAFVAAMARFKSMNIRIEKNRHVNYTSAKGTTDYWHASLDHICDVVGPELASTGIAYSWETNQNENGVITVACVLTHELGHSQRVMLSGAPDNSGGKNSIQSVGSTVSYLQRYTLLASLGLAAADMDDDGKGAADQAQASGAQMKSHDREAQPAGRASNYYPEEKFAAMLPKWKEAVEAGKKVGDVIATIRSRYDLTEEQIKQIVALDPNQKTEAGEKQ